MAIEFSTIVNIVLGALTGRTRGIIVNIAFGTLANIVLGAFSGRTRGIYVTARYIVLGALTGRTRGIIVNIAFGTIRYIVLSALTGRTRGIYIMAIEFGTIRCIVLGALANIVLGVLTGRTREHRVWPGHGAGDDHAMFFNLFPFYIFTQQARYHSASALSLPIHSASALSHYQCVEEGLVHSCAEGAEAYGPSS